jgi:RNA polymerase sigma-70 factor, ECF subfamily
VRATPMAPLDYAPGGAADHLLLALYADHADTARALARRLLYDRGEAEDVVQDAFLTLWHRPTCFDPARGTPRAWLLTVVRNRSLDCLRRRIAHQHADIEDVADRLPDPCARDIAEEVEAAARGDLLWNMVDQLPACQADLIRRAFVSGQSHQEIATATGLPLGTVKSRIRLGLDKLRCAVRSATLAGVDG